MLHIFNCDNCYSVQNKKNIHLQCCHKRKLNELFCGKHLHCKNIVLFHTKPEPIVKIDESKKIYSKEDLFEKIMNQSYISIYSLRQSIKQCHFTDICTKQSKPILIHLLHQKILKERYYMANISSIVCIQKTYRRWRIYKRRLCVNDTDILTFTSKYEIPAIYFYIFYNTYNHKKYAYDIRTLVEIIYSNYPSCPYTIRPFTEEEKQQILTYRNQLIQMGIELHIEKITFTPEEEIEMKMKDIFFQINMLDNYTNHIWFKHLSRSQLVDLYIKLEDIWNYRSNMNIESKKKIVLNGMAFTIPIQTIHMISSKLKLQTILLDEIFRFITEGVDIEERKLGAILILTGLVEISYEAAEALPHLIQ